MGTRCRGHSSGAGHSSAREGQKGLAAGENHETEPCRMTPNFPGEVTSLNSENEDGAGRPLGLL